ncbi:nuclear transport factor 2 family protein [Lichenicoccus sp.]|uniref:nuclear transport factor 2 family protein n=1 Tax=Lichenicoccus sp. TaxID=2781899 RepID=UPI003D0AF050
MLGNRLAPGAETFPEMFADDGVLEYPFAPPGLNSPLVGRDAIFANFMRLRKILRIDSVADAIEIETRNTDTVILEFSGTGAGVKTGEPYRQRYISVITLRNGHISRYKDYWNPIALFQAVMGTGSVASLTLHP